jgi:hypothetical protein
VDQFLERNARAFLGHLPIRLIFAIMTMVGDEVSEEIKGPTEVDDGHAHQAAKTTRRFP